MRIAYIVPSLKKQAPIFIAATLAELMAEQGHSVIIYYFDSCPLLEVSKKVETKRIGFFDKIPWNDFDIVHSHMLRSDVYSFIHKPIFCKTKTVTTSHNYIYAELKNYYNLFVSFIFGTLWIIAWIRMDKICVLTNDAKKYYDKISLNKKLTVCLNGRSIFNIKISIPEDLRKICSEFRVNNKFIIGAYCNLVRRKRIDRLIRLMRELDDVGLIVIGDGPEKQSLMALSKNLNVDDRVLFLGYQSEAHNFNEFFDVFAMPSEDEGFGLSLIEAALSSKKIICSDIPVFKELFNDRSVTFFGSDQLSLKHAFYTALTSEEKAVSANKIALDEFSDAAMMKRYITVYLEVLGNN